MAITFSKLVSGCLYARNNNGDFPDPFVTGEQISSFKEEMDSANVQYEFINYEGEKHSFTNPIADSVGQKFNMPLEYNEKADKESWARMKSVFEKVFAGK